MHIRHYVTIASTSLPLVDATLGLCLQSLGLAPRFGNAQTRFNRSHILATVPCRDERPASSSLICSFRVYVFVRQGDLLNDATGYSHARSTTNSEVDLQTRSPQLYRGKLVADERDYTISGPVTLRAVDELVAARKLPEMSCSQTRREIDCKLT